MRPLYVFLFGCLFIVSACGTRSVELSDEVVIEIDEAATTTSTTGSTLPASTTTATTSTSTTTTTTTTTTTAPTPLVFDASGVPVNGQTNGVVLTTTGWVVPVLGPTDAGWRVWTPCGRQTTISSGEFIESVDIVLDPGHGGPEPGAVGPAGTREADLNLQVARGTQAALEAAGYDVLMTRQSDVRLPIVTRGEIGLALDPIAFISIHHNAGIDAPSPDPGTEMFFQVASPESKRLAGLLYEETRSALDNYDADWVSMSDAGAMARQNREGGDYYGVLRRPAAVTSVLAEFAYIANASEEALLNRADVQDDLAAAVVKAVDRFTSTSDPGSGFTDDPIFRGYGPSGAGRTDDCDDPVLE